MLRVGSSTMVGLLVLLTVACEAENPVLGRNAAGVGEGGSDGTTPTGGAAGTTEAGPTGGGGTSSGTYHVFYNTLTFDSECVPRQLPSTEEGTSCVIAYADPSANTCTCDAPGRQPISADLRAALVRNVAEGYLCGGQNQPSCDSLCLCEVPQATGSDLAACRTDPDAQGVDGWCYVDPATAGEHGIAPDCGIHYGRLRLLGTAAPDPKEHGFIACKEAKHAVEPLDLGDRCTPGDESSPTFSSYDIDEINIETNHPDCGSGVCVANHFSGRASCPYGQTQEDIGSDIPQCFLPYSDEPVLVPVRPQYVARQADMASVCSCRCDGPGPGPFCTCPDSMVCEPLIDRLGLGDDDDFAGSYCIPRGAEYDQTDDSSLQLCDRELQNCGDPRPYPPN